MDERTLNDLLECSVCLERLDTSSKVLPCQHTFCRKCLEVIVSSHQELRCPECRILVDLKIDDLPPNVLLMRILEGLKNATQNQNNAIKPAKKTSNSNTEITNNVSSENSKLIINEQQTVGTTTSVRMCPNQNISNRHIIPHAFALYDFISKETGDLNFKKGDIILLKRKISSNWFVGEINGREGSFPINYVQVIVPLPVPQCIALYDFKMGPNEEEGCLSFKKGAIIQVLRRVDHNWAEGQIGSCIGIFPIAFVEMNSLAKQLLDVGSGGGGSGNNTNFATTRGLPPVPFDNNSSDSTTTTTSPNSTCSSNTSTNSVPSSPSSNPTSPQNQANVKYRDLKEKRHSLNSLTGSTNLSVIQANRHSAEILSVPDPVELCNAEQGGAPNSIRTGAVSGAPNSIRTGAFSSARSADHQQQHNQQQHNQQQQQQQQQQQFVQHQQATTRANVLKTSGQQAIPSLPWAYVALYPYKPKKNDELELKKGCVYFVTERCLDGWYKGKNWADKSGVFPGNYVTPLRSRDQQQLMHQRKVKQNSNQSYHIISNVHTTNTQNNHNYANLLTHPPPELPPRSNASPSGSAWTKPITQHVETFFSRKNSIAQQQQQHQHQQQQQQQQRDNKPNASGCGNIRDESSGQINVLANNSTKEKEKKDSNSTSAVSLMKRLTNIKRSKSPIHAITYSMDNPVFEDSTSPNPTPSPSIQMASISHPVHVRSGSCPSQLLQSLPTDLSGAVAEHPSAYGSQRLKGHKERPSVQCIRQQQQQHQQQQQQTQLDNARARNHLEGNDSSSSSSTPVVVNCPLSSNATCKSIQQQNIGNATSIIQHRKSQSLDANTISSQINCGNNASGKVHKERFRCIVSYPPNSEMELELNVGDIVFVHRKQKNGWYKGTHARTNKTGLFPASFVEPDI